MTNLMRKYPTIFPADLFGDLFGRVFNELDPDIWDPATNTISLRKFPKGDLYNDSDGNRVIELALAGYSRDQLSVFIESGTLVVAATKCDSESDDSRSRTLARRAFRQVFSSLGKDFNLDKAKVVYKDGLLKIIVPKAEKQIVKKLDID